MSISDEAVSDRHGMGGNGPTRLLIKSNPNGEHQPCRVACSKTAHTPKPPPRRRRSSPPIASRLRWPCSPGPHPSWPRPPRWPKRAATRPFSTRSWSRPPRLPAPPTTSSSPATLRRSRCPCSPASRSAPPPPRSPPRSPPSPRPPRPPRSRSYAASSACPRPSSPTARSPHSSAP